MVLIIAFQTNDYNGKPYFLFFFCLVESIIITDWKLSERRYNHNIARLVIEYKIDENEITE
jgi:hypothetical protein